MHNVPNRDIKGRVKVFHSHLTLMDYDTEMAI
jgi:hypothetical protein